MSEGVIPTDIVSKMVRPTDADKQVFNLVTTMPVVSSPINYLCLLMNIIIPGTGTFVSACYDQPWNKTQMVIGVL